MDDYLQATQGIPPRIVEQAPSSRSYVDWPAIIAGALVVTAVSFVATAFGSAIGLTMTSTYDGTKPEFFYPALAIWLVWITVSSFAAGGYITGRLRRRFYDSTEHEVDVRDGAHGLIVWAVAVVISALLTSAMLGGALKGGGEIALKAAGANVTQERFVDHLLRGDGDGREESRIVDESTRRIVGGILTRTPDGAFSNEDRSYLSTVITSHTNLPPRDSAQRLDSVSAEMKANFERERLLAEKARKAGIIIAFLAASTLAVGAATAYSATRLGGRHRDENIDFTHLVRPHRVV